MCEIKCKTFRRDHGDRSGNTVEGDIEYFIKTNPGFELISQSHSYYHKEESGQYGRDKNIFTVVIFYKINEVKVIICNCDNPNKQEEREAKFKVCSNCKKPFTK
jgi:hypothetical protein